MCRCFFTFRVDIVNRFGYFSDFSVGFFSSGVFLSFGYYSRKGGDGLTVVWVWGYIG